MKKLLLLLLCVPLIGLGQNRMEWAPWFEELIKNDRLYHTMEHKRLFSGIVYWNYELGSGPLEFEETYKDGKLNGVSRRWYENGQLYQEKYYKYGKQDGSFKRWYKNGNIMYETEFLNGTGIEKHYYENNQLESEVTYLNNIEVSKRNWYKNSHLQYEIISNQLGSTLRWRWWYENGNLESEHNYRNDRWHGKIKKCSKDGKVMYETFFVDGTGVNKWFHKNGKLKTETHYKNQNVINEICWNEDGYKIECK